MCIGSNFDLVSLVPICVTGVQRHVVLALTLAQSTVRYHTYVLLSDKAVQG